MNKTYTQFSFIWGLSEDDFLNKQNTFLYSENIDISESNYIQLAQRPVQESLSPRPFVAIYNYKSYVTRDYWTSSKLTSLNPFFVKNYYNDSVFTYTPLEEWRVESLYWVWQNFIQYKWNTYVLEDWEIVLASESENYPWGFWYINSSLIHNLTRVWSKRIASDYSSVISYNNSWYQEEYWMFSNQPITWFAITWWNVLVFHNDWIMDIWDWESTSVLEWRVNLWIEINSVSQFGSTIYVIGWGKWYILNWYSVQQIIGFTNSQVLKQLKLKMLQPLLWWTWAIWNQLYFRSWELSSIIASDDLKEYWWEALCKFWQEKSGFPTSISKYLTVASTWKQIKRIFYLEVQSNSIDWWIEDVEYEDYYQYSYISSSWGKNAKLYMFYEDSDWTFWIDCVYPNKENQDTVEDGLIIMNPFQWKDLWEKNLEKVLNSVSIRVNNSWVSWDTVKLYKVNADWNLDLLWEMEDKWNWQFRWIDLKDVNFYDITLALRISHDSVPQYDALKIYGITYNYELLTRTRI